LDFPYHRLWFFPRRVSTLRRLSPPRSLHSYFVLRFPLSVVCAIFRVLQFFIRVCYEEPLVMEWTTPQHEEIDLNCEISSYANAEL
jgi:hypothetical protein